MHLLLQSCGTFLLLIKLLVRKMMGRSMILWLPEKVDSDGRQLAMCLSSSLMTCKSLRAIVFDHHFSILAAQKWRIQEF